MVQVLGDGGTETRLDTHEVYWGTFQVKGRRQDCRRTLPPSLGKV